MYPSFQFHKKMKYKEMNSYLDIWFAVLLFVVFGAVASVLFFRRFSIPRRKPKSLDSVLFESKEQK
jgi:hypothetical protein